MIQLITNADDFGMTVSITDAIIDSHLNGIMKSTTIMINREGTDYAIKKAKEISSLGVGIHFNLTGGKPISSPDKIPELLNEKGNFKPNKEQRTNLLFGKHKLNQVKIELKNQLEYLLDNGITPSHYDSHHHITGVPLAFRAAIEVAQQHNINKARITNTNYWYNPEFTNYTFKLKQKLKSFPKSIIHNRNKKTLTKNGFKTPDYKILPSRVYPFDKNHINQFINTLRVLKNGITEISFHPGYANSSGEDSVKTAQLRLNDLEVAKSDIVKEFILHNKIQLINFNDI
ncbi:MAG: ChbG/HpnK family deacetylase [Chitinophagaceae bacterium]|nr:ChbG/HpnK family deacetylase [Chitinophagaceae bacterium]